MHLDGARPNASRSCGSRVISTGLTEIENRSPHAQASPSTFADNDRHTRRRRLRCGKREYVPHIVQKYRHLLGRCLHSDKHWVRLKSLLWLSHLARTWKAQTRHYQHPISPWRLMHNTTYCSTLHEMLRPTPAGNATDVNYVWSKSGVDEPKTIDSKAPGHNSREQTEDERPLLGGNPAESPVCPAKEQLWAIAFYYLDPPLSWFPTTENLRE